MTVIVENMEMPHDCEHCPFKDYEQGFCYAAGKPMSSGYYNWTLNVRDNGFTEQETKRHPKCPLNDVVTCDECIYAETQRLRTDPTIVANFGTLHYQYTLTEYCSRGKRKDEHTD